jgi:small subunit ribosomal protein S8
MPVSDPIADMLTRVRNASVISHEVALVPNARTKLALARILKEEGFIQDYDVLKGSPHSMIRIRLKYYANKEPAIRGLKRVSKPGLRLYVKKGEIPRIYGGLGVAVLSTSRGLMTGHKARNQGVGGELLCYVW